MSKIAIIIPFYKIDFFEQTIRSVAAQTNKNFVLYIGNDASPEDPLPIIRQYLKPSEYRYYDYHDNLGGKNLALQWERILENVQEDWFQILGDDDVLADNFVEEFYKSLDYCNLHEISCMKVIHYHIDDNNTTIRINDYNTETIDAKTFFISKYLGEVSSSLSENIFQTQKYRKHRFEKIPLAWGSDDIAVLSFSEYGKIYYNRNTYVKVRISEISISGSKQLNQSKENAYNKFRERFILNHSKVFSLEFINKVIDQYLRYCYNNKQKANYSVANYYLKKFKLGRFAKTLKKIQYVNSL
ncbi:glycosyltransferase family A protein [Chryseobacterium zhengzhouense]|uniref:Glycosyltransferase family A protein n=1 Tax=Chryseobacterium zhengzhouense TaxID=1636086 RepID=A0ABW2LYL7_9FLAO